MVPVALGTQTGGSVVRPASFCGVVGFKVSYGLISMEGVLPFAKSLDTLGFFTHTAADMLAFWGALGQAVGRAEEGAVGALGAGPAAVVDPLRHPDAAAGIDVEAGRVHELRLGGEEADLDVLRGLEALQRLVGRELEDQQQEGHATGTHALTF